MVDTIQIPNLPAATALDGAEMFEVVQGGVSSRATVNQVSDLLGAVTSVNGQTGAVVVTKTDVGLGNADNTSDANKPVSIATQTALNLKAPIASPTFTGTVSGITATMVGLGNVDNTSDANKPVSTATQTALNLKANLANPTFTGTVGGITATMVGLGNVDNTSDANKPVSTAQRAAILAAAPAGQCYLQITGANLELIPMGGSVININGALYTLPASTTLAATGAAALTAYYIYAYMVSTTITLERSTTGYTVNSSGVPQKTGDATRTLVGQAYTNGASAWAFVLSYWNRKRRVVSGAKLAANRTVTATGSATVNSFEAIVGFLAWPDEAVHTQLNGSWTVVGVATGFAQIVYDGATIGQTTVTTATTTSPLPLSDDKNFTAGTWHTADLWGDRTGGPSVIFVGGSNVGECGLQTVVNG